MIKHFALLFGWYGIWRGLDALQDLSTLGKAGPPLPENLAALSDQDHPVP